MIWSFKPINFHDQGFVSVPDEITIWWSGINMLCILLVTEIFSVFWDCCRHYKVKNNTKVLMSRLPPCRYKRSVCLEEDEKRLSIFSPLIGNWGYHHVLRGAVLWLWNCLIFFHLVLLKGASSVRQITQKKSSMEKVTCFIAAVILMSVIVQESSGKITTVLHGPMIRELPTERKTRTRVQSTGSPKPTGIPAKLHQNRCKHKRRVSSGPSNVYRFKSFINIPLPHHGKP